MNTKYFQTVSTIMIVLGALGIVGSVGSISGGGGLTLATGLLAVVTNLLQIVAGVIGRKAVKTGDSDKAPLCRILSYALLAVAVISLIIGVVLSKGVDTGGINPMLITTISVVGGIVSLILPVLYFLGARKLD